MKSVSVLATVFVLVMALLYAGCGTSGESTQESTPASTPPVQQPAVAPKAAERSDTVNVQVQTQTRPTYESKTPVAATPSAQPAGKYSVQVGAYKMADNAERVASLAKERFGKNVYTMPDKSSDLYKVMVGDFMTKDEARAFRDQMATQYPGDYKDAWVSENVQK